MRKCRTISIFRKKIHTACILDTRRAYRSTPGAPDARSKHYLLHLRFSGVRKCRTVSIFRKKNPYGLHSGHTTSVSLDSWSSRCTICILFTAFLRIRELAQKTPKKCNTLRNLDVRVCESVELSAFSEKKNPYGCILDTRRAYRSTPGAPDARFAYYLQHFCGLGDSLRKS